MGGLRGTESKLSSPSWFSIFEMILMCLASGPSRSRIDCTSDGLRMKDAAIMSTFCSMPNLISDASCARTVHGQPTAALALPPGPSGGVLGRGKRRKRVATVGFDLSTRVATRRGVAVAY